MNKNTNWIWSENNSRNQHVLFVKNVKSTKLPGKLNIKITAAYHYELFINGKFISRGPVHGNPENCLFDELYYDLTNDKELNIAIIVNYYKDTHIHYLIPTETGGLAAEFSSEDLSFSTDETWKCIDLDMWKVDAPEKSLMINYLEDYDSRKEPQGWDDKYFTNEIIKDWDNAVLIPDYDKIWSNYSPRPVPYLKRKLITPKSFTAFKTDEQGADKIEDISTYCEKEELQIVEKTWRHLEGRCPQRPNEVAGDGDPPSEKEKYYTINNYLKNNEANVFTFDLGKEFVGFYYFEIDAPEGTVIEFCGAEAMKNGRPWIHRIDTLAAARYISKSGRQKFTSFTWDGFRYIHFVIRNNSENVKILDVGCVERKIPLKYTANFIPVDNEIKKIFELCKYTLEISP